MMASAYPAVMTVVYTLEGAEITSLEEFWRLIGEAVNGPGGYFGSNLDAFNDCLRGGFGTPEGGDFAIEWRDHEISRRNLGYPETVRQLQIRLSRCHPTNGPFVRADLEAANARHGTTVFDWLVEIINDQARALSASDSDCDRVTPTLVHAPTTRPSTDESIPHLCGGFDIIRHFK
jgi:RNAse (barnase) inhibitor barstar